MLSNRSVTTITVKLALANKYPYTNIRMTHIYELQRRRTFYGVRKENIYYDCNFSVALSAVITKTEETDMDVWRKSYSEYISTACYLT